MHGGLSLRGPASKTWKTGRYSRTLPRRLLADAQRSLEDPQRLSLLEELALVNAKINDVLGRVDTGESGALWDQLHRSWKRVEAAQHSRDVVALGLAMAETGELITRSHDDYAAWGEVMSLIERRRKLVETERKYEIETQQLIHVEQVLALMRQMVEVVLEHVQDDAGRRAIVKRFFEVTGLPEPREEERVKPPYDA